MSEQLPKSAIDAMNFYIIKRFEQWLAPRYLCLPHQTSTVLENALSWQNRLAVYLPGTRKQSPCLASNFYHCLKPREGIRRVLIWGETIHTHQTFQ